MGKGVREAAARAREGGTVKRCGNCAHLRRVVRLDCGKSIIVNGDGWGKCAHYKPRKGRGGGR